KRSTKGFSGQEVALFPTMLDVLAPSTSPSRITSSPSPTPLPSPEPTPAHTQLFIQAVTPTEVIQEQEGSEKASDEVSTAGAKKGTATDEVPIVSTA
ncbi:hypothetical protein Tco_0571887, partial [Tanacetum coccineum]